MRVHLKQSAFSVGPPLFVNVSLSDVHQQIVDIFTSVCVVLVSDSVSEVIVHGPMRLFTQLLGTVSRDGN